MTLRQLAERSRDDWPRLTTVANAAKTRPVVRIKTKLNWLDELTGGGFVAGAAYLIHGEPGAGKSTLLAQAAGAIRGAVYISGEEEISQVAHRFQRLGLESLLIESKDIESSLRDAIGSHFVVVDSAQVMSVGVMAATELAVDYARANRVVVALVCHQTKAGLHAGPRTVEHLVDCSLRVVRGPPRMVLAEKNRFGGAGVGLSVEMTERGLICAGK